MSKLIVSANSLEHLKKLLKENIDGVILSVKDLAVNDSYYVDIDLVDFSLFKGKEVFFSINKLMHNSDLDKVRTFLEKVKDKDVKLIFYDMAVYNIACELGIVDKLVIAQDHLNASTLSNNFYYDLGIKTSYITSDITMEELLNIKHNSKIKVMFLGYGYAPIFYSRRYLINNYLEFINRDNDGKEYKIVSDTNIKYPIKEEKYGTTIYTPEVINLVNYIDDLKEIDYLVLKSNMIDNNDFIEMTRKFINHEHVDNAYLGFLNTKTIYKIK